jgi:hypothetical protein
MTEIVEVYRNLHKDCWSVRDSKTRLVISHVDEIHLHNATLVVQPAGRERVLREKRKNVHAFIKGTQVPLIGGVPVCCSWYGFDLTGALYRRPCISYSGVIYNPYRNESFVLQDTGEPITHADHVYLNDQGKAFIGMVYPG